MLNNIPLDTFLESIKYSRPTANEVPCSQRLGGVGITGGPHGLAPCCEAYALQQIGINNQDSIAKSFHMTDLFSMT